jgi:hypothetical protein
VNPIFLAYLGIGMVRRGVSVVGAMWDEKAKFGDAASFLSRSK